MNKRISFALLILIAFSALAWAQIPSSDGAANGNVLPFKVWKEMQVADAQNQAARMANRLHLLRSGRIKTTEQNADSAGVEPELSSDRVAKSVVGADQVEKLEREHKRALDQLEFAKKLSLEDYFTFYVTQFQEQPEIWSQWVQRLSKDEVAELLKAFARAAKSSDKTTINAKRNKPPVATRSWRVPLLSSITIE